MSINYVIGDATQPIGGGPKIIVHVCNDIGGWGRGFVMAISKRWAEPEKCYRAWHRAEEKQPFALGEVQFVWSATRVWPGESLLHNTSSSWAANLCCIRLSIFDGAAIS